MIRPAAILAVLLPALAAGAATRVSVARFEDPAGDATGTGRYVPPTGAEFRDGDFDLRRFEVLLDGDDAVFEVTLGASVRAPTSGHRENRTPLELTNGIYLQNVDIYVDRDRSGAGHTAALPGRRVALGGTWQRAIVLTPQPGPTRAVVARAMGDAARDVIVAAPLEVRGRTVAARVPVAALGGTPDATWAYSVHVSGARWERSFQAMDLLRGSAEEDAFTMPVLSVPETWAFGGGPMGRDHPQVIDVLLPAGANQARVLSAFGPGQPARVPFVLPGAAGPLLVLERVPERPATSPAPPAEELVVQDADGKMLSASGPVTDVRPLQFGVVVDGEGRTIGRVLVVRIVEGGLVASVIEQKETIVPGARIRFEEAGPRRQEAP